MIMNKRPKIGIALSSGGVRGLAHLGVLGVMEEAGVPLDFISGTSMGGLIAGVYAAGIPIRQIVEFSRKVRLLNFATLEQGWRGLFGHTKVEKLLVEILGRRDLTFADLKIPLTVVATDIETGDMVLLNEGPLIPAFLATCSFPIVFAPFRYHDRWLVDGGIRNNFPVDIVRQMGADKVIGVITPMRLELGLDDEHPDVRPWFSLGVPLDWIRPAVIGATSVNYIIRTVDQYRLRSWPPDLLLEVNIENVGTFVTEKSQEIVDAGRNVAIAHLEAIRRLATQPLPPRWQRQLHRSVNRMPRLMKSDKVSEGNLTKFKAMV